MKDTVLESAFKIVDPSSISSTVSTIISSTSSDSDSSPSSSQSNDSDSAADGNRRAWEEIGTILFPFGENHSMRRMFTGLPNPKQSLIVLIVCLSLLLIIFILIAIRYCCKKGKNGDYSAAPSDDKGESSGDVIDEVKNRREQKTPAANKSKSNAKVNSAKSKSNKDLSKAKSSSSGNQDLEMNANLPVNGYALRLNALLQLCDFNPTSQAECPLPKHSSGKLIPHESLRIPEPYGKRPYSSVPATPSTSKFNVDNLLRLSNTEKLLIKQSSAPSVTSIASQTNAEKILKESTPLPRDTFVNIDLTKDDDDSNGREGADPKDSMTLVDFLTPEQNKEELQKFLNECRKNEASRRRSLCSFCRLEEFGDTEISVPEQIARKAHSMPEMDFGPFTSKSFEMDDGGGGGPMSSYSTDIFASPAAGWSPVMPLSIQHSSSNMKLNILESHPSLSNSEWQQMRNIFSLPMNKGSKSKDTSNTSIWSTAESENLDIDSTDTSRSSRSVSFEDRMSIDKFPEATKEEFFPPHQKQLSRKSIAEFESPPPPPRIPPPPPPRISPPPPPSKKSLDLIEMTDTLNKNFIRRKPSLTAAELITESAKKKGYNCNKTKEGSSDSGFLLASDRLPSELFPPAESDSSLERSSHNSFMDDSKKFWLHKVVQRIPEMEITKPPSGLLNEFDPFRK